MLALFELHSLPFCGRADCLHFGCADRPPGYPLIPPVLQIVVRAERTDYAMPAKLAGLEVNITGNVPVSCLRRQRRRVITVW